MWDPVPAIEVAFSSEFLGEDILLKAELINWYTFLFPLSSYRRYGIHLRGSCNCYQIEYLP